LKIILNGSNYFIAGIVVIAVNVSFLNDASATKRRKNSCFVVFGHENFERPKLFAGAIRPKALRR
jgi:hypothetical protein